MTNDDAAYEVRQHLVQLGMVPFAAEQAMRTLVQQGAIHTWPSGIVSVLLDGRIDSSPDALRNLAGRILAGAPSTERRGASPEEMRALREAKLTREGSDYAL
jgi:hypothetical protein